MGAARACRVFSEASLENSQQLKDPRWEQQGKTTHKSRKRNPQGQQCTTCTNGKIPQPRETPKTQPPEISWIALPCPPLLRKTRQALTFCRSLPIWRRDKRENSQVPSFAVRMATPTGARTKVPNFAGQRPPPDGSCFPAFFCVGCGSHMRRACEVRNPRRAGNALVEDGLCCCSSGLFWCSWVVWTRISFASILGQLVQFAIPGGLCAPSELWSFF